MAMVVMGLFDDQESAQEALRALEAEGFPRESIDVRSGKQLAGQMKAERPSERASERSGKDEEGLMASIRHFFQDIAPSSRKKSSKKKSSKEQAADSREANVREINDSNVLIMVAAPDDMVEQAADIMEEYGVVDTELPEQGCVRIYEMVVEEEVAVVPEEIVPTAERARSEPRPVGQPASTVSLSPEEEQELAASQREFQNQWQANRAGATGLTSDQVLPGYQYGYLLGRSPQYSGTEWATIEPQVQREWDERRYGPWDHLKEVVRSGWERAHK